MNDYTVRVYRTELQDGEWWVATLLEHHIVVQARGYIEVLVELANHLRACEHLTATRGAKPFTEHGPAPNWGSF